MNNSTAIITTAIAVPLLVITTVMVVLGSDTANPCTPVLSDQDTSTAIPLAGLDEAQLRLARAGVAIGRQRGEPADIIIAELAAQATETGLRNLANPTVPESLSYPNDGAASDHDSVGPHQMRASVWGSAGMAALMDPAYQITWFYDQADKLPPNTLGPAELAQAVEKSAPNAYARTVPLAQQLYAEFADADLGVTAPGCLVESHDILVSAQPGEFGHAVITAAQRWIGTPYVWGGGTTNGPSGNDGAGQPGFDCSGLTLFAVYHASGGRIMLSHYTQDQQDDHRAHVVMPRDRRPGDLVFFTAVGQQDSHHVAIYLGRIDGVDQVVNAPTGGQRVKVEALSDWAADRMDFRRFGEGDL